MKYNKLVLIFLFTIFLSSCQRKTHPSTYLNFRSEPKMGNNITRVLSPEEELVIINNKGKWLKVQVVSTGEKGWVYTKYVNSLIANINAGNVRLLGMVLTAILTTLFAYVLALFAVKISEESGERGNPTFAFQSSGGALLGAFIVTNILAGIPYWKITIASIIGIIVDMIFEYLQSEEITYQAVLFYLIGVACFPLIVVFLVKDPITLKGFVESFLKIQRMLSIFE